MKHNVQIKKHTREMLRDSRNKYETVEMTINRILDKYEDVLKDESRFNVGFTNITISKETMDRIKSCALYDKEGYDSILFRALILELDAE